MGQKCKGNCGCDRHREKEKTNKMSKTKKHKTNRRKNAEREILRGKSQTKTQCTCVREVLTKGKKKTLCFKVREHFS